MTRAKTSVVRLTPRRLEIDHLDALVPDVPDVACRNRRATGAAHLFADRMATHTKLPGNLSDDLALMQHSFDHWGSTSGKGSSILMKVHAGFLLELSGFAPTNSHSRIWLVWTSFTELTTSPHLSREFFMDRIFSSPL